MPEVQVCLCCFGLFAEPWTAGEYVNFKHKCQEADLMLHIGFAGVQGLNVYKAYVWAVFSFNEFLGRRLGTPLASLF